MSNWSRRQPVRRAPATSRSEGDVDAGAPIDLDRWVDLTGSPAGDHELRNGSAGRPSGRTLGIIVAAVAALAAVFALGRSAGSPPERAAPVEPTPTQAPTPTPAEPPALVDLLGEGSVVGSIDFGNRTRVDIWCRETVPGTSIGSTLALLHFAESLQFGEQLIRYEELTKPWVPLGGRRGVVLETEGLGSGDFAQPQTDDEAVVLGETDGSQCERCAPSLVEVGGDDVLIGDCVHGVPFRAGIVYAIAQPVQPGQTPLGLHAGCGVTEIEAVGDRLRLIAEAPLLRGLHDAQFPLPTIEFTREQGWFQADDLELLDYNCEVTRSTQLEGGHLLRTEPVRRLTVTQTESLIGEIGLHGPVAVGLEPEQCSSLTRAWWSQDPEQRGTGQPISDLIGIDPPNGHDDWFYACQPG